MIKRCNDFGAGGVSVAIGELADGLDIDLNKVPKKYEGLDGTELAISESQERMAVVVAAGRMQTALSSCLMQENLEATRVAVVKDEPYLREYWNGEAIVNISRAFLDTNGAEKHIDIEIPKHGILRRRNQNGFCTGIQSAGRRPERLLQARPFRGVRLHHRKGNSADAIWRKVPAHTDPGYGQSDFSGKEAHGYLFTHVVGL